MMCFLLVSSFPSLCAVMPPVVALSTGNWPSFLSLFANLLLGFLWGVLFLGIRVLGVALLGPAFNLDESAESYVILTGILFVFAHTFFALVTHFKDHELYLLFWQCWPWNLFF